MPTPFPKPRTGKQETTVQLNGRGGLMNGFVSQCEGFLLGPRGEVWDLHPWVGYEPRLLVETIDERPALAGRAEQPRELRFSLFHQSRFLAVFAVTERLEPGIRAWQSKNGHLELGVSEGAPALLDCQSYDRSAQRACVARLDHEHWVGAARTPYLLVCQRAADRDRLLAFARAFDLPQGKAPLFTQPLVATPRQRLSALADRHLAGLRRLQPQAAAL